MQIKAMKAGSVHLYSDRLSEEEKALTGVDCVESLSEAVAGASGRRATSR